MDKLTEFECFVAVAERASFTAAARALGIAPSGVSKQVRSLEDRLGVRLFNRTTRHVGLTEAGRAFRERIEPLLAEVSEAEQSVRQLSDAPRGRLRIGAPMDFGRAHLSKPIADFAAQHAQLELEVEFADRFVDVVGERFDVVVRIGALRDSNLIARHLGPCRRVLCASPSYLDDHGRPRAPEDLKQHTRVGYTYESERSFVFEGAPRARRVTMPVRHRTNNGALTRDLILGDCGIALLPTFLVGDDLRAGRLECVLPELFRDEIPIHALVPHRKHLAAKVRYFLDFLLGICGAAPWDEGLPG